MEQKAVMRMSQQTYNLLFQKIQQDELWALMAICNSHLTFELHKKLSTAQRPAQALYLKDVSDEKAQINQQDVQLGLLKGGLEDLLITRDLDALLDVWLPFCFRMSC